MSDERNIDENLPVASYVMAPDGEFFLAEERQFTLGDVRVEVLDQEIYAKPPYSPGQEESFIEQAESLTWPLYTDWGQTQVPLWLPITEEGLATIQFRNEVTGSYSGQINGTLYAEEDGRAVGNIDYVVYLDEVHISMIYVDKGKRRGGIATMLVKRLQAEYPDKEIDWGYMTPEGQAFFRALDRTFEPNPMHAELQAAYEDAKAEYAALEKQDLTLEVGERMNELDALIYSLEDRLRHMKSGRWQVNENEEIDMSKFVKRALSIQGEWKMDKSTDAAVPHDTWRFEIVDPLDRFVSRDTNAIILDYGPIGEGPSQNRMVWLRVRIESTTKNEDVFGGERTQVPFAFDKNFWIKPSEKEFEEFRQAVEESLLCALNRLARRHQHIHLREHESLFNALCLRIVNVFEVDRWS